MAADSSIVGVSGVCVSLEYGGVVVEATALSWIFKVEGVEEAKPIDDRGSVADSKTIGAGSGAKQEPMWQVASLDSDWQEEVLFCAKANCIETVLVWRKTPRPHVTEQGSVLLHSPMTQVGRQFVLPKFWASHHPCTGRMARQEASRSEARMIILACVESNSGGWLALGMQRLLGGLRWNVLLAQQP